MTCQRRCTGSWFSDARGLSDSARTTGDAGARPARSAAGEPDAGEGSELAGGDRPVSLAAASLRGLAARLAGDLQRTREAIGGLVDIEQLEAELAAVRRTRRQQPGLCLT